MANGQIPLNPLSALFRGFQTGQAAVQKREQDAIENELTQQLRQIQLINAQRALTEASKTPQQRLAEQIQEAFTVDALKRGALVQAPVGLEGESIALPSAIGQTAAQLEAAQTFSPAIQATPLDITTGQPSQPSLSDALSQIVVPQVQETPSFNIPTAANKGFEEPSPIPGFNISEEAARQKMAKDLENAMALAGAKRTQVPPGFQLVTDENGFQNLVQVRGAGAGTGVVTPVKTQEGEQLKGRVPGVGRSVLAEDPSGRITNIVLRSGESLPEGYKEHVKSNKKAQDPTEIRKEFNGLQVVKDYREIVPQYQRMQEALEEAKTTNTFTAVDQTLINTFNKILDPQSVVRESEYARTAEDQSVLDYLKGKYNPTTGKIVVGGAGLTPENRQAMLRMAERFVNTSRRNFDQTASFYENVAEQNNIDPTQIIQGIEQVRERAAGAAPATQATTAPSTSFKRGRFTVTPK